jgi:predicted kinase
MDLLNTRNKEGKLLQYCFDTQSKMVIDNTNVSSKERKRYIDLARKNKYKILAYYFESDIKTCLERNKTVKILSMRSESKRNLKNWSRLRWKKI